MTPPRFLLDENVNPVLREALKRREPTMTVWSVSDPGCPALGTKDPEILAWCEQHAFMLVTHNRRSMPVHLARHLSNGGHVPGIIVIDAAYSLGQTIEGLLLIWAVAVPGDYVDRLAYLAGEL